MGSQTPKRSSTEKCFSASVLDKLGGETGRGSHQCLEHCAQHVSAASPIGPKEVDTNFAVGFATRVFFFAPPDDMTNDPVSKTMEQQGKISHEIIESWVRPGAQSIDVEAIR